MSTPLPAQAREGPKQTARPKGTPVGYRFDPVPAFVSAFLLDRTLKPVDELVLKHLLRFRRFPHWCWCAKAKLAAEVGRSPRTVQRAFDRLGRAGLIEQRPLAGADPDDPRNRTGWRIVFLWIAPPGYTPGGGPNRAGKGAGKGRDGGGGETFLSPPPCPSPETPLSPGAETKLSPKHAGASNCPDETEQDENDDGAQDLTPPACDRGAREESSFSRLGRKEPAPGGGEPRAGGHGPADARDATPAPPTGPAPDADRTRALDLVAAFPDAPEEAPRAIDGVARRPVAGGGGPLGHRAVRWAVEGAASKGKGWGYAYGTIRHWLAGDGAPAPPFKAPLPPPQNYNPRKPEPPPADAADLSAALAALPGELGMLARRRKAAVPRAEGDGRRPARSRPSP